MELGARSALLKRLLFGYLCIGMLGLQGCGLGWLYMRIGDTHRIRGTKILDYDTTEDRFAKAQAAYERAIGYYRDSLLYDEFGNPEVYHKYGFTALQLSPPDLETARGKFETGIRLKREQADKAGKTDDFNTTPDDDFSQMSAGMGTVTFWTAIATKNSDLLEEAIKHYAIADATSTHSVEGGSGWGDKVLDYMNLKELLTPVPPKILIARVHLYRARKFQDEGHPDRAKIEIRNARDAIEETLIRYAEDPRAEAEMAQLLFLDGEYAKCVSKLQELSGKRSYADKLEHQILLANALTRKGEPDEAIPIFTEIHERFVTIATAPEEDSEDDDRKSLAQAIKERDASGTETQEDSRVHERASAESDPANIKVLVGRAHAYAAKGDLDSATADIDEYLRIDPKDPRLYLEAGKALLTLQSHNSAITRLLKGYYIDTKDITLNYQLGKAYQAAGRTAEMRDCFGRVYQLDPTSAYAKEVAPFLK